LDGKLFFSAITYDASSGNSGYELWWTDGTEAGTVYEEIVDGARGSYPDNFAQLGDQVLFFAANGDLSGVDLRTIGSVNTPPTADAGPDQTIECTSASGTLVNFDGSASSDPDTGDSLT
jgi:ELWxxDGT repeat protein